MPKFNHAFDFAFTVISEDEKGKDVTAADLRARLIQRVSSLSDAEMLEACGAPFDTYPEDEKEGKP